MDTETCMAVYVLTIPRNKLKAPRPRLMTCEALLGFLYRWDQEGSPTPCAGVLKPWRGVERRSHLLYEASDGSKWAGNTSSVAFCDVVAPWDTLESRHSWFAWGIVSLQLLTRLEDPASESRAQKAVSRASRDQPKFPVRMRLEEEYCCRS